MSGRVPLQLRRGLVVAASIVAVHAILVLLCYAIPPAQKPSEMQPYRSIQKLIQPEGESKEVQDNMKGELNVSLLTLTMTGCSKSADWQALGLYYSYLRWVSWPGLCSVTPRQLKRLAIFVSADFTFFGR